MRAVAMAVRVGRDGAIGGPDVLHLSATATGRVVELDMICIQASVPHVHIHITASTTVHRVVRACEQGTRVYVISY